MDRRLVFTTAEGRIAFLCLFFDNLGGQHTISQKTRFLMYRPLPSHSTGNRGVDLTFNVPLDEFGGSRILFSFEKPPEIH
jgi:hypothetical protein